MPTFIDNVTVTLNDELKATLRTGSRLSIAAASFSIYAYEALKKELENIEELHFLFTKPTFTKTDAAKNGKDLKAKAYKEKQPRRKKELIDQVKELELNLKNGTTKKEDCS